MAPCYKDFALAIRLKNGKDEQILLTNANIREWLPGDNVYDNHVFIPIDMKPGTYNLQVGIIDAVKGEPKVKLAIEGKDNEGWYTLDKIEVVRNP